MTDLAATFRRFAVQEALPTSPLYAALANGVAGDRLLLDLACQSRDGQPAPNMLFASVHYLLMRGDGHELAAYYPGLCPDPLDHEKAFGPFRRFCLTHQDALIAILASRSVGTNEIARASVIRAGMAQIMLRTESRLSTVEIGASAGLLMLWNRVGVDYGNAVVDKPAAERLLLSCESRAEAVPTKIDPSSVGEIIGIDLEPMNINNTHDRDWLDALIWPEYHERRARLRMAMDLARTHDVKVLSGDGVGLLPEVAERIGRDDALCVFHAFTFNQVPQELEKLFLDTLARLSRDRDVFRLGYEWRDDPSPTLALTEFSKGRALPETILAHADAHGRWISWQKTPGQLS